MTIVTPEIDKGKMKRIQRIVEKELKAYKAYKVALVNREEVERHGLPPLFPSFNHISDKALVLKVKYIQRTLENALNDVEREIITRKYLGPEKVNDMEIYMGMGIGKDDFYKYKREAIVQTATALRII